MGMYIYTRRNKVAQAITGEYLVAFEFAYKDFTWEPSPTMKRKLGQQYAAADRACMKTPDIKYATLGAFPQNIGESVSVFKVNMRTSYVVDDVTRFVGTLTKVARGKYALTMNKDVKQAA